MNKWRRSFIITTVLLFATILLIIIGAYPYLTAESAMGADILVVEGWQSDEALQEAAELFLNEGYKTLITTGGRMVSSHYLEQDNELKFLLLEDTQVEEGSDLKINVSGIDGASYELIVCDSVVYRSVVTGTPQDFTYTIPCKPLSIVVKSLNRRKVEPRTKNIFIKYLLINDVDINRYVKSVDPWAWKQKNGIGELIRSGGPRPIDHANRARNKLIEFGLPFEKIIAAPGDSIGQHRTKNNALGSQKEIKAQGLDQNSITLFTTGIHARRSHILYEQALGKKIGVVVYQDPSFSAHTWWLYPKKWKMVCNELSGCAYYSVFGTTN